MRHSPGSSHNILYLARFYWLYRQGMLTYFSSTVRIRSLGSASGDLRQSVSSYSLALINMLVSLGLLLLYTRTYESWKWDPPFRCTKVIVVLFLLSNVFLVVVPFIPPSSTTTYTKLPYWVGILPGILCTIEY